MASIEESILQHLQTNWGTKCPISWEAINQAFDPNQVFTGYDDNDSYIIPSVHYLSRMPLEVPVQSSAIQGEYILKVLIVPDTDAGTTAAEVLLSALGGLYTNQTVTQNGARFYFRSPLRNHFQTEEEGSRKSIPWKCEFTVFE